MHQAILKKLRSYRNRIRAFVTFEGSSYVALVTAILVVLSLLIDYSQRLGTPARILALAVGLAVIGYTLFRQLLSKLARPMDDDRIALTVEDRFPDLADRLISALQFARVAPPDATRGQGGGPALGGVEGPGQSLAMMSAVSSQAAAMFEPLDLTSTLDSRRVARAVAAAALAWLALLAFAVYQPATMNLWFQRNVLLMNVAWPQRTHLLVDYKKIVPRGDALTVRVKATGVVPSTVTIRYRFRDSGRKGVEDLARIGLTEETRFETTLKNVVEPLEFMVSGGDAQTDWFSVSLIERPAVAQLRFWAVYPTYTRLPPRRMEAQESFLEVLPGTELMVAAVPTKTLKRAWLALDLGDEGKAPGPGAEMTRADAPETKNFWFTPAEQKAIPEFWTASLKVITDCSVAVNALDTDDLANRPPTRFTVRMGIDKEPLVLLKMTGIGEMIVPAATLPLEIKASDDFGIASLSLKHKFLIADKSSDEETIPFKTLTYGAKELAHDMRWSLEPLGLQPGGILVFRAEATDYKDVEPKNVGKTENISLRVVTPDELMADIVRRQVEQHQDFLRIRDRHREAKVDIDAAERTIAARKPLTPEQKTALSATQQVLRHSTEEVRRSAGILEQALLEMTNNKLGDTDERSKLRTSVVQPMQELALKLLPALADDFKSALAASGPELGERLVALTAQNDNILKQMDLVLNNMLKLETYRRVVDQARKLRDTQENVLTEIEKERRRILESILNP